MSNVDSYKEFIRILAEAIKDADAKEKLEAETR